MKTGRVAASAAGASGLGTLSVAAVLLAALAANFAHPVVAENTLNHPPAVYTPPNRFQHIRTHIRTTVDSLSWASDKEMAIAIKEALAHEYPEFCWTVLARARDRPGRPHLWKADFSGPCDRDVPPRICEQTGGSVSWLTSAWDIFAIFLRHDEQLFPPLVVNDFKDAIQTCTHNEKLAIATPLDLAELMNCLKAQLIVRHEEGPRGLYAWCSPLHKNQRMEVATDGRVLTQLDIVLRPYDSSNRGHEMSHSKVVGIVLLPRLFPEGAQQNQ